VEAVERLKGNDAVRATRIAGLYANVLNGLATAHDLPYGGYGTTAVCNDSAALVQQCLYGENTIYPMTSIGRYMQRCIYYAQSIREQLALHENMEEETRDLVEIVQAMKNLPSDINATPANAASAARRMLCTLQNERPFVLMDDAKRAMEALLVEDEMEQKLAEEGNSYFSSAS
jgi:hypothetical protein